MASNRETGPRENQNTSQEFKVFPGYLFLHFFQIIAAIIITIVLVALTLSPSDDCSLSCRYFLPLFFVLLGGNYIVIAVISFQRQFHAGISTDEDGFWLTHLTKDIGLIPWDQVYKVKDHPNLFYLDVFDSDGNIILRINRHLKNFQGLEKLLLDAADGNLVSGIGNDNCNVRKFDVAKDIIRDIKHIHWFLITFILLLLAFLVHEEVQRIGICAPLEYLLAFYICFYGFYGIPLILFSLLSVHYWVKSKRLPFAAVALDEDGIWRQHETKTSGLIPWNKIYKLKEHPFRQHLDIMDADGNIIMQIEYELDGFSILRDVLLEKVEANYNDDLSQCFNNGMLHHLLYAVILIPILFVGILSALLSPATVLQSHFVIVLCAAALLGMYLCSVYRIEVDKNKIILIRPIGRKYIYFSNIIAVELMDKHNHSNAIHNSWVQIMTTTGKTYSFSRFVSKVDAHVLYLALKKALEKYQANAKEVA